MQGNGRQAQYNTRSMCFEWTTLFPLEPDIYVSSQVTSSTRILWASHFLVCVFWKNFPLVSARLLTCTPCPQNCESVRQCRWTGCYCTLSPYQNSPCWNIIALYIATPFSKKKSASHPSIANSPVCRDLNRAALHQSERIIPIHRSKDSPNCGGKQAPACMNTSSPIHCWLPMQDKKHGSLKNTLELSTQGRYYSHCMCNSNC